MQKLVSFAFSGSYSLILSRVLADTPFTAGSVPTGTISNPTVIENASRREVLSTAADLMGCEIEYDGWTVNLVRHRGSTTRVNLPDGENVTAVEVSKNRVEGTTSYTVLLGSRGGLNVGDDVHITYQPLGLDVNTRIIVMRYHPYHPAVCSIEVGDYQSANNLRQTWDYRETILALLFCGESCKLILRSRINQRRDSYS